MTSETKTKRSFGFIRLALPCGVAVFLFVGALVFFATIPSRATALAMPANVQTVLFRKIFAYNKGLDSSRKVLIVYSNEYAAAADEVYRAFQKLGQSSETAPLANFAQQAKGAAVVYVLATSAPPAVQEYCAREHVFSVAPIPALAERGEVSVAIGVREDQKPEIVVHLNRAKAEGQDLPMPLLGLARVIR